MPDAPYTKKTAELTGNSPQEIWERCLHTIRNSVAPQAFSTWFEPIVPVHFNNGCLTIQVPSQYFYEVLEEHYLSVLREVIDKEIGPTGKLNYSVVVDTGGVNNKNPLTLKLPTSRNDTLFKQSSKTQQIQPKSPSVNNFSPFNAEQADWQTIEDSQLVATYNFENYLEGDCNRLARSAGMAVASKPGTTAFNPLMIYGGVGLGKTHLVQAIGNKIKQLDSNKFVLYVSTDRFVNQFIDALRVQKIQEFTQFYMQVDVLILDDIQSLAGKERTQDIFFNIFNHLHQKGKQIIITSDRAPKDLAGLTDRLINRFRWGLMAELDRPDFETRVAIIQMKMESEGIYMPYEVITYLAESVENSIRELEGILVSLVFEASVNNTEFNVELARKTISRVIDNFEEQIDIDFIQKAVSEYFQIPIEQLKAKTRKKEIVTARQVAMYFAKTCTNFSLKAIGQHFGGRDHTTVMHAIDAVNEHVESDMQFKNIITELQKKFKVK